MGRPHLLTRIGFVVMVFGLAALVPARANIIINPTYDSSITTNANSAALISTINQALGMYEAQITTPITVNIVFQNMNSGLGQSSTFFSTVTYSQYLAALQAHSSGDATDTSALATLPGGPNNPVNGSTSMDVTTANLRALGFNAAIAFDSTIGVNTAITNFVGKTFNPSFYSLTAVLEHEIDEALGLGSNLDNGTTAGDIRAEDLFRYSATGVRSYNLSTSTVSYFSIDGGVTNLVRFNQAGPPGGSDYGDWATGAGPAHVQDAFGTPGSSPAFNVEGVALDAIGYNFETASVPEPSSICFMALGVIGLLAGRKRFGQLIARF